MAAAALLHLRCHSAPRKNASTASSRTSTGHPIEVTFCTQPPPALSYISVHCPGLQLPHDNLYLSPKVIAAGAADDGLFLLRVPLSSNGSSSYLDNDYFVYGAHHREPNLDLVPNPYPSYVRDDEVAVLRCGDERKQYVVAALRTRPFSELTLELLLYRSDPGGGGEVGSWTSQLVSVEEPLRDTVCPIPDSAERLKYHITAKVIVLGGTNGTVAFVDLWRGILLCDVLAESPTLRDVPLPLPARGNWRRYLCGCERIRRDITISQQGDSFRYIEMEITLPRMVSIGSQEPEPALYLEWVRRTRRPVPQPPKSLVPGWWKVTTWSMPIPVTSWDDWRLEHTAELSEFNVDNPVHYKLLHEFMSGGDGNHKEEANKEAALSLGRISMGYPAFSIDDDVVYLLCKNASTGKVGVVIAFNERTKELQGVAQLDRGPNIFRRCFRVYGISKHLVNNTAEISSKQILKLRDKQDFEEENLQDSKPYVMVGSMKVVI